MKDYKYEVAISFVARHEVTAMQLHDALNARLRTFIYSKQQEEIIGTDGMDTFSNIFSSESRLNVLLYSDNYGKTPWTRVEETMIKDRVFNEGWETLLIVKLDKAPFPKWIPKTYLYVNFNDKGINGTSAIIEYKVSELGGKASTESLEDFADRVKRDIENEEFRRKFLNSSDALSAAYKDVAVIFSQINEKIDPILQKFGLRRIEKKTSREHLDIGSDGIRLRLDWYAPFSNAIDKSYLRLRILKEAEHWTDGRLEDVVDCKYLFSMNLIREIGWIDSSNNFYRAGEMVNLSIKAYLEQLKNQLLR
jgi:hypothetical protein